MASFIESMTKFAKDIVIIRVWREEENLQMLYPDTYDAVRDALDKDTVTLTNPREVKAALEKIGRVTAFEIVLSSKIKNGQGVVYYMEWP